jgi:hypothetical protein
MIRWRMSACQQKPAENTHDFGIDPELAASPASAPPGSSRARGLLLLQQYFIYR